MCSAAAAAFLTISLGLIGPVARGAEVIAAPLLIRVEATSDLPLAGVKSMWYLPPDRDEPRGDRSGSDDPIRLVTRWRLSDACRGGWPCCLDSPGERECCHHDTNYSRACDQVSTTICCRAPERRERVASPRPMPSGGRDQHPRGVQVDGRHADHEGADQGRYVTPGAPLWRIAASFRCKLLSRKVLNTTTKRELCSGPRPAIGPSVFEFRASACVDKSGRIPRGGRQARNLVRHFDPVLLQRGARSLGTRRDGRRQRSEGLGTGQRVGDEVHIEKKFGVVTGKTSILRIRYYNIQPDRFSWTADRCTDGGKTWLKEDQKIEAHRIGDARSLGALAPAR